MGSPVAELINVSRTFPPAVTALDDVSLIVRHRETLTITGTSGSGKSTLLNVLGLLDRPDRGQYLIEGVDVAGLPDRQHTRWRSRYLSFVFQSFHLVPHLTVRENIEMGLAMSAVPGKQRRAIAEEALEAVGMTHRLKASPRTLSGGEQQRVAIARAWARRPALMLCDEPTGNLDSDNTAVVLALLRQLAQESALVIVTHDAEVAAYGDRRIHMRDGRIVDS